MKGTWLLATTIAFLGALGIACERCDEGILNLVSGDYTIAERVFGSEDPSDAWTGAVLPGAEMNIDLESDTMTLVYEREGTTYQVVYDLKLK